MKVKIIKTGSIANCVVVEFSDKKRYILDCGKGTYEIVSQKYKPSDICGFWTSHDHADHAGDKEKFAQIYEPLKVKDFVNFVEIPVHHGDAECNALVLLNNETKEAFIYAVDFTAYKNELVFLRTMQSLYSGKYKIVYLCELSHWKGLAKHLSDKQRQGLDRHLSGEEFIVHIKKVNEVCRCKVITLHASGRQAKVSMAYAGGSVCNRHYTEKALRRAKITNVLFGQEGVNYAV